MNRSEQINELALSLSKAQGQMRGAAKDSSNPFFKSTYADLQAVWDAIRAPFAAHGLAVVQTTLISDTGALLLETVLVHQSGQWISGHLPIRPVKDDPQGTGSALTYCRRYGLMAIAGVAPTDDDGNAASEQPKPIPSKALSPIVPKKPVQMRTSRGDEPPPHGDDDVPF